MGKKKEKLPDDTPIEKIEYISMNLKDLKKFAIRLGNELAVTRKERYDFEIDRDNITHYWSNAVYQLMKVERDIRRLEREMIHKNNILERSFVQKQYDLVDARYDTMTKLVKVGEGSVMRTFDKIRDVVKTERAVFSDRLQLRNEYWNSQMTLDNAIMKMKQRARCKEMDKIILVQRDALLETVDERNKIFDELYTKMETEAEEQFRKVILMKNKKVHDIRKEHESKIDEIQKNFEDFRKNDMIVTYRKQIMECKEESAAVAKDVATLSDTYCRCLMSFKVMQTVLDDLKTLEPSYKQLKSSLEEVKYKYKQLDKVYTDILLETDELEDTLKTDKNLKKDLWKACFQEIMNSRQKQIKIHLAIQTLTRTLAEELVSKEELLERYHNKKGRNLMPLLDIYNRYKASRLCLQEILDRTLKACGSSLDSLGILPPEDFLRPPPPRVKLPPLPPTPRAPTGRPRLEWAYPKFRFRPPFIKKNSSSARAVKGTTNPLHLKIANKLKTK